MVTMKLVHPVMRVNDLRLASHPTNSAVTSCQQARRSSGRGDRTPAHIRTEDDPLFRSVGGCVSVKNASTRRIRPRLSIGSAAGTDHEITATRVPWSICSRASTRPRLSTDICRSGGRDPLAVAGIRVQEGCCPPPSPLRASWTDGASRCACGRSRGLSDADDDHDRLRLVTAAEVAGWPCGSGHLSAMTGGQSRGRDRSERFRRHARRPGASGWLDRRGGVSIVERGSCRESVDDEPFSFGAQGRIAAAVSSRTFGSPWPRMARSPETSRLHP